MNPLAMRNTGNKAGKSNNSRLNTKADDCLRVFRRNTALKIR